MAQLLSSKSPLEVVPVTFDFSALVAAIDTALTTVAATATQADALTALATTAPSPVIPTTVSTNPDASPSAVISGAPFVANQLVIQLMQGGLPGSAYKLSSSITSGAEVYTLSAIVPVVAE